MSADIHAELSRLEGAVKDLAAERADAIAKHLLAKDALADARRQIAEQREALKPLAEVAHVKLCGVWRADEHIWHTDAASHITFGQARRAAALLSKGGEGRGEGLPERLDHQCGEQPEATVGATAALARTAELQARVYREMHELATEHLGYECILTALEDLDRLRGDPKPGDVRMRGGKRCRLLEIDDKGEVWEILDAVPEAVGCIELDEITRERAALSSHEQGEG